MVTLFRSKREIVISGIKCVLRAVKDGEELLVTLSPEAATVLADTSRVTVDVAYGDVVHSFVDEELDAVTSFAYAETMELTLSGEKLYVDGKKCKSFTFAWNESAGTEEVQLSYSIDRVKELYTSKLTVTAAAREGLYVRPLELSYTYTDRNGNVRVRRGSLTESGDGTYVYENQMNDIMVGAGSRMQYRIEVAVYADEVSANEDLGERFLGLADVTTPNYIISAHHAQSAPFSLTYRSPVAGARVRVSWQAHADANTFTLERSCDGGAFVRVYEGTKRSFADAVPKDAATVAYRVRAVSSSWWYGESELVGHSNLYIGTPHGIRAIGGLYVGESGEVREITPIMSVGGIK